MSRATITVIMRVETDADERALERAIDRLIDESSICAQFLEGESLTLRETSIAVDVQAHDPAVDAHPDSTDPSCAYCVGFPCPEHQPLHEAPDSERTRRADHALDEAKDPRNRGGSS